MESGYEGKFVVEWVDEGEGRDEWGRGMGGERVGIGRGVLGRGEGMCVMGEMEG